MSDDIKVWKKKTWSKNRNTGNVCFSLEQKCGELKAGQILAVYEPKKPKVEKNCRGKMVITQADIDAMELKKEKETSEMYYLMAYSLTK